jgi:hypothetical protein
MIHGQQNIKKVAVLLCTSGERMQMDEGELPKPIMCTYTGVTKGLADRNQDELTGWRRSQGTGL